MIELETKVVVGDVGFMGPPDGVEVEIGLSVIPERRRRGYASEAARAMVDWALHEPTARRVIGRCDADNEASIRVLERAGLERTGAADGRIYWRTTGAGRGRLMRPGETLRRSPAGPPRASSRPRLGS